MCSPHLTLAIVLAEKRAVYGEAFVRRLIQVSGCSGQCGLVWMRAGDYTQLLVEWATDHEGPVDE